VEIGALITSTGCSMQQALAFEDPKNGNRCLHIGAQNGHMGLVKFLVDQKADLNAQNKKGQTPLHMSVEYDYYFQSKFLLDSGADRTVKNGEGFEAITGIEGTKIDADAWDSPLTILKAATTKEEVDIALKALEGADLSKIDKAALAQTGMAKKKACKDVWDPDRFMNVMKML